MSTGMALDRIGRYEIVGPLGKGAMGVVYKATDPTIGRTVALKTMRLDVQGPESSEMLARFKNEARLAGVLNHPNIVTIYDAGETNGLFYMAMEYIQGRTLYQLLLQEHVLPMNKVLDIARQICAGLDTASGHRVVHRDVKPANIMILPSGLVKIMDFGIAKCGGSMTSTGEVLGTPNYMSPEQVRGRVLDGRSDLFSFGVILYEMITGEKPFTGDNITTIIYKIVNEEPIPPRELDPTIHPGLNRVMLKALAKNPEERYQLGAHLVSALESYEGMTEAELETPKTIPEGVFNFPQQPATSAAPKRPASVAAAPARAKNGSTIARGVATKALARRPAATHRSVPLLPTVAGALVAFIIVVSGAILYLKHEQAKHKPDVPVAQQENTSAPAETTASVEPEPTMSPAIAAPSISEVPAPTELPSSEPSPRHSSSKVRDKRPLHTAVLAKAPPSAAMTLGEIVLSSEPDDVVVSIDGNTESGWRTPFTATAVSPGSHTVLFNKGGYVAETRIVEVKAGEPAFLRLAMRAVTAVASIKSDPEGAAIIIDDREISKVTPADVNLAPGEHSIAVRKSGFQEATTDADLREGQPYSFAPVLKPLDLARAKETHGNMFSHLFGGGGGWVSVEMHTAPRGAEILVNGELYPKTTPTKLSLEPGEYEITFRLPGYKTLRKNLTVNKGPAIRIEETLQK